MDILKIMDRIKALQEFEIKTTLPEDFQFKGKVPFDMEIVGDEVTMKVFATSLEEAMNRADAFLFGVNDESN